MFQSNPNQSRIDRARLLRAPPFAVDERKRIQGK